MKLFETDDLDEAQDVLGRTYARMRMRVVGPGHRLAIVERDLGPVALHRLRFRMCFTAEVPPMGHLVIGRTRDGATTRKIGRGVTRGVRGELLLAAQPDERVRVHGVDHDGEYALFRPGLFARIADPLPGRAARPIRFTGYRPISESAAQTWNNTFDYVRDNVPADEPLLVGSAVRLLAAVTLAAFPNTAVLDPTIEDRHDAHPATLRRAITFIDENAGRDITPADIAAAARVTVRAVQLAFRRHQGTTPTAYLRRVRLERAHRQLLESDPGRETVSAVAMCWGFASHSSFSAQYRAAYGVPPSVTLGRR